MRALVLLAGAPEPRAPPCIRQRPLPDTFGDLQDVPDLVIAPHFAEASIGAVLRGCCFLSLKGSFLYWIFLVLQRSMDILNIVS